MPYSINRTSSPASGINVNDAQLNSTFDINLIGKGYPNYGEVQQENLLHVLENFANDDAPLRPTPGQLWFNTAEAILYVRTPAGMWKSLDEPVQESIYNAHINADAQISIAKLELGASAQIMVLGSGGIPAYRVMAGDVAIDADGNTRILTNVVDSDNLALQSVLSEHMNASVFINTLKLQTLDVLGAMTGTLTGNADTATVLETGREFSMTGDIHASAVSFDGGSNLNLVSVIQDGVIGSQHIEPSLFVNQLGSSSLNSIIVNAEEMTANTFTGDLVGNADTVTQLQTPRKITLIGEVGGSVIFDGTGDVSITTDFLNPFPPIAEDAITPYELAPDCIETIHMSASVHARKMTASVLVVNGFLGFGTLQGNASSADKWSGLMQLALSGDVSGQVNFDGGSNANMGVTVNTASQLRTARKISLGGDLSGSVLFNGSGDVTLNAQVADNSHNHDSRYYTEAESDARYLSNSGGVLGGTLFMGGAINMQSNIITALPAPLNDLEAANKKYVDDRIGELESNLIDHFYVDIYSSGATSESSARSLAAAALSGSLQAGDYYTVRWQSQASVGTGNGSYLQTYDNYTAWKVIPGWGHAKMASRRNTV